MTTIDNINLIDIEDILRFLEIRYKRNWPVLSLYDKGRITDWRKADINKWIITDFSEKGRPAWDRIDFISNYFNISKADSIKWFVDNFWIVETKRKQSINPIRDKWEALPPLTEEQIEYLKSRRIDYNNLDWIVKNNNWRIAVAIRSVDWSIKSIQSRTIKEDDTIRYFIEKSTDSDWIFYYNLDSSKPAIVVVEWLTDFLSLRQFTPNIVWLVNAKNDTQIDYIKTLSEKYKIFFIPDNDEAWASTIKKFKDKGIKFNLFRLENYWVKDINEILVNFWIWIDILDLIFNDSEKPISNMRMALEKAREYKKLYRENSWKLGFASWYQQIDKFTDWFIKGKTYLIMAYSNQGKTRFAYSLLRNMIELNKKIHFYSLEVDTWMLFLELVGAIKKKKKDEVVAELDTIDISELEESIEVFDSIRSLEAIENNIKNERPDVAFIDFVQNIEHWGQEYEKMTEIALRIQKLAILTWTTIISLSQVSNESRFSEGNDMMPKGSWALFASSDVIFSLWGREWSKYLTITKNKFWQAGINFDLLADYPTSSFSLLELEWPIAQKNDFTRFKK